MLEWGSFWKYSIFLVAVIFSFAYLLNSPSPDRHPTVITDSKSKKFDDVFLTIISDRRKSAALRQSGIHLTFSSSSDELYMPNSYRILFQASAQNKLSASKARVEGLRHQGIFISRHVSHSLHIRA